MPIASKIVTRPKGLKGNPFEIILKRSCEIAYGIHLSINIRIEGREYRLKLVKSILAKWSIHAVLVIYLHHTAHCADILFGLA